MLAGISPWGTCILGMVGISRVDLIYLMNNYHNKKILYLCLCIFLYKCAHLMKVVII